MSDRTDPTAAEPDEYAATAFAEPAPVLGPYIGVVGGVLCSLVGAFLLLAPYAFDYRDGAAALPHSSAVDLATGGAVLLLGLLTAALFGGALGRRLRVPEPAVFYAQPLLESALAGQSESRFEGGAEAEADGRAGTGVEGHDDAAAVAYAVPRPTQGPHAPVSEPEAHPVAPAASLADPGDALRDLLTPLVAALAADLRARESGENEGKNK